MDKYIVGPSLCRWAIINFASQLWKRQDLKNHLATTTLLPQIEAKETMPFVLHRDLDVLFLPSTIRNELKFAVGSMGTRIRKFLQKIASHYDYTNWTDFVDFIDHIHWTALGCIDVASTNRALYRAGLLPMNESTWRWLCAHCIDECITDFFKKMTGSPEYKQLEMTIRRTEYYWPLRIRCFKHDRNEFDIKYMLSQSELHWLPYFWHRLDEEGKMLMLWKMSNCSKTSYGTNYLREGWDSDISSLMFLIRQYSKYKHQQILSRMIQSKTVILAMLIWPLQPNFLPLLKEARERNFRISDKSILWKFSDLMNLERIYIGHDTHARKLLHILVSESDTISPSMLKKTFGNIRLSDDDDDDHHAQSYRSG